MHIGTVVIHHLKRQHHEQRGEHPSKYSQNYAERVTPSEAVFHPVGRHVAGKQCERGEDDNRCDEHGECNGLKSRLPEWSGFFHAVHGVERVLYGGDPGTGREESHEDPKRDLATGAGAGGLLKRLQDQLKGAGRDERADFVQQSNI